MADDKLNTGPGEKKIPEAPESVTAGQPQALAPEQAAAPTPQQEQAGPAKPDPGDVVQGPGQRHLLRLLCPAVCGLRYQVTYQGVKYTGFSSGQYLRKQ